MSAFLTGAYTNAQPTTDNDLFRALLKYPEILPAVVQQFPMYSMTNMTQGLGNYATKAKEVGNRQVRWGVMGRLQQSSTYVSSSGTGSGNTPFTIVLIENTVNPGDVLRFINNQQVVVQSVDAVQVSGGYQYQVVGDGWTSSATFDTSAITAGTTCGVTGNKNTEKSTRGYSNTRFPDQYDNFTTIGRKAFELTRTAGTDRTWFKFPVTQGGGKGGYEFLWTYEAIAQAIQDLLYKRECDLWLGNRTATTDSTGAPSYNTFDANGDPIISGDGFLNQIWSNNVATYSGALTEQFITGYLARLQYNSGTVGKQTYLVDTSDAGFMAFDRAMKNYYIANAHAVVWNANVKSDVTLGGIYKSYVYGDITIMLNRNPVFADPTIFQNPVEGFPLFGYTMVFRNITEGADGQDVKMFTKGMSGANTSNIIMKKISGMWDWMDNGSEFAANGFDGCTGELLTEYALCVTNPSLHGVVYRSA